MGILEFLGFGKKKENDPLTQQEESVSSEEVKEEETIQ